jgi:integrase
MINHWSQTLFLNLPKVMRIPSVAKPIVTFSPEFVKKFLRDEDNIYNKLESEKKMVWEISATILITTMRVSDAISLEPADFNIVKDSMFLNKRNSKTNAMSQSPLPKLLSDRYRENLARFGRIYTTVPSKNKIYEHMKDMFRMYEDLHELFTVSKMGIRGEPVTETKPLYEWAHPHLLRKTAITTMIANKVPDRHIKFLSGHAENSASYGYYIGHVEKHYQSDMIDYFNKNYN